MNEDNNIKPTEGNVKMSIFYHHMYNINMLIERGKKQYPGKEIYLIKTILFIVFFFTTTRVKRRKTMLYFANV